MVKISNGNSKMGKIPSVSLPPIKACGKDVPCKSDCYALKAYRLYPTTRKAWDHNLECYNQNPDLYFASIGNWLVKHQPRFFRWHVAGDILDQFYLDKMRDIAKTFPKIKFLAFTKRIDLTYHFLPDNLSIVFSMWPGFGKQLQHVAMPKAWLHDPANIDPRIPGDALECPGNCDNCGMCWHLKNLNKDVVFYKH